MNLDFGGDLLHLPGANAFAADLDYFEFKAGYSWSPLHPSLTTGTTVFYSPDYFAETGPVWTIETMPHGRCPRSGIFSPVVNGLVGWQKGNTSDGYCSTSSEPTTSITTGTPVLVLRRRQHLHGLPLLGHEHRWRRVEHLRWRKLVRPAVRVHDEGRRSLIAARRRPRPRLSMQVFLVRVRSGAVVLDSARASSIAWAIARRHHKCSVYTRVSHASAIATRAEIEHWPLSVPAFFPQRYWAAKAQSASDALKVARSARPEASFAASDGLPRCRR